MQLVHALLRREKVSLGEALRVLSPKSSLIMGCVSIYVQ
jgi:hypothetical protein